MRYFKNSLTVNSIQQLSISFFFQENFKTSRWGNLQLRLSRGHHIHNHPRHHRCMLPHHQQQARRHQQWGMLQVRPLYPTHLLTIHYCSSVLQGVMRLVMRGRGLGQLHWKQLFVDCSNSRDPYESVAGWTSSSFIVGLLHDWTVFCLCDIGYCRKVPYVYLFAIMLWLIQVWNDSIGWFDSSCNEFKVPTLYKVSFMFSNYMVCGNTDTNSVLWRRW